MHTTGIQVKVDSAASSAEQLAAKELQGYLQRMYPEASGKCIRLTANLPVPESYEITGTADEAVIAGGGPRGVLYGAYALLEKLGCRFYLSGDVVPPPSKEPLSFAGLKLSNRPLVSTRFVLNWHNYLTGLATWNLADWQQYIGQAMKMGFNTLTVHTYGNNPADASTFKPGQTRFIDEAGKLWETQGGYPCFKAPQSEKEFGRCGLQCATPVTLKIEPIEGGDYCPSMYQRNVMKEGLLAPGRYKLHLLLLDPDSTAAGQRVFKVAGQSPGRSSRRRSRDGGHLQGSRREQPRVETGASGKIIEAGQGRSRIDSGERQSRDLALGSKDIVEWTMQNRTCKDTFDGRCWAHDQIGWAMAGNAQEAAKGLVHRFRFASSILRFPIYGNDYSDGAPDWDHFGCGSIALQRMRAGHDWKSQIRFYHGSNHPILWFWCWCGWKKPVKRSAFLQI